MLSKTKKHFKRRAAHFTQYLPPDAGLPSYVAASPTIAEWHARQEPVRFLFGGNRAGKSEALAYECVTACRSFPQQEFWIVALSYEMCRIVWEKVEKYLSPYEVSKISWLNSARGIPALITLQNGSRIFFKSCDQGRKMFQAASVKGIFFDEEPPRDIYKEALMRTVDCGGFICCSMTPLHGRNWVYHQIYQLRGADPNIHTATVSLLENRYISEEHKQRIVGMLTQDEIQARIYGNFTVMEGAVFKEFSESQHVIDRFPLPAAWRRIKAIDFGHTIAFATLWAALSPDGALYVYAEYKQGETLLADHAEAIRQIDEDLSMFKDPGKDEPFYASETALADHDAQARHELDHLGIYTEPANKTVDVSIQILNRLMKQGKFFIFSDLHQLADELVSYRYKPIKDGHEEKEVVLKINDHLVDCLRYIANYFFLDDFQIMPIEPVTPSRITF